MKMRILLLLLTLAFISCNETDVPKPKGYYRINLPAKNYREYNSVICPFRFDYPVYANIMSDSMFFNEPAENPCWLNLDFESLNARIHLSYKNINENNQFSKLVEDAHKMTFKHTMKAQYIDESLIKNKQGVAGMLFEVGGDAASNIQFFLTDSNLHFIRGALYFHTIPNEDSLMPVIKFVKEDMMKMIESFEWSN